jgi:hypothetical protein
VFLLIDLRWRDSEVLKAGYWLVGRELLTTDSVKRTRIVRARPATRKHESIGGVCNRHDFVGFGVPGDI